MFFFKKVFYTKVNHNRQMEKAMATKKEETVEQADVVEETVEKKEADKKETASGPSKFPDFGEVVSMGKTLCGSVQKGVENIISDYKDKRK